ncbi:hypothetical protein E5U11_24180 [Salmonella enterica subsp. enterica]|nr:hypothetical protein [Salmonella enterica subsp. enterica]
MQREKPPEWREKQKGSRGIRRGQRYRLVFQFPIREQEVEEGRDPVELDDEIIEAMRFVTPPPEAPVNKTNREKYSCPVCHINLWGKPGIVVYCGGEHCNKAALVVLK